MALFLEILTGELRGTRTPIADSLVIGRAKGQLTIRDSKLSSQHAKIELRGENDWWLIDLGSANGIKIDDLRVRELQLVPGTSFILGRTSFLVISTDNVIDDPNAPQQVASETVTRTAGDQLEVLAGRAATTVKASLVSLRPIIPVLKLKIVRGLQTGEEWFVGYGPRMVGSHSVDLQLKDFLLPSECFRLLPENGGVVFKTEHPSDVLLNGKSVKTSALKHGDHIDILQTRIEVIFHENR